jgi:hypothetical protein
MLHRRKLCFASFALNIHDIRPVHMKPVWALSSNKDAKAILGYSEGKECQ